MHSDQIAYTRKLTTVRSPSNLGLISDHITNLTKVQIVSMKIERIAQKARSIVIQTVIILVISLSLGEVSFRIYNHYRPTFLFYSDSYNRFRGKPFADDWNFKLNSYGFKDKEFSDKRENVYRILGIGDSFSFGVVPYEYNYLTLIESQLQLENADVEVLNMGIPSIGPKDYLSLFVREGLSFQPDMVLLSFFVGNDFNESKKRKFYEHSYIGSFFHYILNLRSKYEGKIIHGKAKYCDDCPNFNQKQYLQIEYNRSFIYLVDNENFFDILDNALYYLNQFRSICKDQGIEFVVVIIPDELQINQDLQRKIKETYPDIEKSKWDITLPNRTLSNKLNALGIDNIDLYEYFADMSYQLYRPRDTHWNIAGNKFAANIIQKYIRKYLTHNE